MAIGIVESDSLEQELEDLNRPLGTPDSTVEIKTPDNGRRQGDNNAPMPLRKIIGETAVEEGRQAALDLARQFGLSASSVAAYTKGATSTDKYNEPDKDLKNHIDNTKDEIATLARGRLKASLESLTTEKLAGAKVRDLASVAQAMSAVVKNMEPDKDNGLFQQTNFVFYAPRQRAEEVYPVIDVET